MNKLSSFFGYVKSFFSWIGSGLTNDELAFMILYVATLGRSLNAQETELAKVGMKKSIVILSKGVFAIAVPLALIILVVLIFKVVLVKFVSLVFSILLIAISLLWLSGSFTKEQSVRLPIVTPEWLYRQMYAVVLDVHEQIGAYKPLDWISLASDQFTDNRNGVTLLKLKILKNERAKDINVVRSLLQGRINNRLMLGMIDGLPRGFWADETPVIWLDHDVHDGLTHYELLVLYVWSERELDYVHHRLFEFAQSSHHEPPMDDDF